MPFRLGASGSWLLFLLALPVMLIGIGRPEVTRTQEARVLEVARQMLGRPAIDWLIPKLNTDVRLQKPPMTYWMSAIAFEIGGVREGVGRVPTVICGWLTLAVVYCAGRWLFGARCGLLAAACLLGSYYFARHTRLAETDMPATLFVTLAMYALWRGIAESGKRRWIAWMHLAGFAMGMSIVCKGAPGVFPFVFLVAFALVERSTRPIVRFLSSGAILTFALIALPWFLFAGHHEGWGIFIFELRNVERGADHGGPVYQYIPWLIVGTLPWTPVALIAVVMACRKWKADSRLRGLLIWLGAIALPLCVARNKQSHYLIPLMPVLMIFAGWLIDRWNNRALMAAAIVFAIALPPAVTLLVPRLSAQHARETAEFVRTRFDNNPICFYGQNSSVPLCFNLKRAIPFANDEPELKQFLAREPRMIVITISKDKRPTPAPEFAQFEKLDEGKWEDQVWDFYRLTTPSRD